MACWLISRFCVHNSMNLLCQGMVAFCEVKMCTRTEENHLVFPTWLLSQQVVQFWICQNLDFSESRMQEYSRIWTPWNNLWTHLFFALAKRTLILSASWLGDVEPITIEIQHTMYVATGDWCVMCRSGKVLQIETKAVNKPYFSFQYCSAHLRDKIILPIPGHDGLS